MIPITYFEENRLYDTHGNAYAAYVIDSQDYAFQPTRIKEQLIGRVTRALTGLTGEYFLFLLARQLSSEQVVKSQEEMSRNPGWRDHQEKTREQLEYDQSYDRLNLLVVPLKNSSFQFDLRADGVKDLSLKMFSSLWRGVQDVAGKIQSRLQDFVEIPSDVLAKTRRQAFEVLTKIKPLGNDVRPAKLRDIEWWLKKSAFRGLDDPELVIPDPFPAQVVTKSKRTVLRPVRTSLLTLSNFELREKTTSIQCRHPDGRVSHQTFFVTVDVPQPIPAADPTGREFLYGVLEKHSFPVDCAIHILIEPPNEAKKTLRTKEKIANEQYEEFEIAEEDPPIELEENMAAIPELKRDLQSRIPQVHATTIFAIGAPDEDTLSKYVTEFKSTAGDYHVLIQPPFDMKTMYQAFYPFAGTKLPRSWQIPMHPGVLACGVPFGTRALGDPSGAWLGRLGTDRPVFMNPWRPATQLNTSPNILLVGQVGSGKSVTMKYLEYIILTLGGHVFAIDPKGDHAPFLKIPELEGVGRIVDLTDSSNTQFTPFRLASKLEESKDFVTSLLELILNPKNNEDRNFVISNAVDRVYRRDSWDMHTFAEEIEKIVEENEEPEQIIEAKRTRHRLRMLEKNSLASCLFGRDNGDSLFDRRLLVAVVRGLTLPKHGKRGEDWSEAERISAGLLFAVATLGLKHLMKLPKGVLKCLAIDECWVLREFEAGRKLLAEALRLSRSENLIAIMASQNATDFEAYENEEDITGHFGWKFFFRLDSLSQVEAALRILGINEDPKTWTNTFAEEYKNGLGLVKDPESRIGEMQVEVIQTRLMEYFDSTPEQEGAA